MTDRQLADQAWHELTLSTDSYPAWKKKGYPATSHWAKAKALLDQIGFIPPPKLLWEATHETGDLSEWGNDVGGGIYTSGTGTAAVTSERAHSGTHSLKLTASAPPQSGVRPTRWAELNAHREVVCTTHVFLPEQYTLTGDPATGQFWILVGIKSRPQATGPTDPFWSLELENGPSGLQPRVTRMPPNGGWKAYPIPNVQPFPVGQWVKIDTFIRQGWNGDGHITFALDGKVLIDLPNVTTSYRNPAFNAWECANEWQGGNVYTDGVTPSPAVLYVDDCEIRLP